MLLQIVTLGWQAPKSLASKTIQLQSQSPKLDPGPVPLKGRIEQIESATSRSELPVQLMIVSKSSVASSRLRLRKANKDGREFKSANAMSLVTGISAGSGSGKSNLATKQPQLAKANTTAPMPSRLIWCGGLVIRLTQSGAAN